MRVLTATSQTHGRDDVCTCEEGELVLEVGPLCGRCHAEPDPSCACRVLFWGLSSTTPAPAVTTTAMIRERDLTADSYAERIRDAFVRRGLESSCPRELAGALMFLHHRDPVGRVFERDGLKLIVRC